MHLKLALFLAALLSTLSGCVPVQAPPTTPAVNSNAQVTEVLPFDPASIAPAGGQQPIAGTCEASQSLSHRGAYRCTTDAGATFDPCFARGDSEPLGCKPNPVAGTYSAFVNVGTPLPTAEVSGEKAPFFLNLGAQKPTCSIGTTSSLEFDGTPVTYSCAAPGAWILGALRTDQPAWQADYVVTDSNVSTITYGPEATFVVQAWVY